MARAKSEKNNNKQTNKKKNKKNKDAWRLLVLKVQQNLLLMLILLNLAGFLISIILTTNQLGYITLMRKGYEKNINPQELSLAPIIKLRP